MNTNLAVILGGQRCGSTLLATVLGEHPEILLYTPLRPEPKFFLRDEYLHIGRDGYMNAFFPHRTNKHKLALEKSTSYIENPQIVGRVLTFFPDAKFLVILRNPFDRLISNYKFSLDNGIETRSLEGIFLKGYPPPELKRKISVSPFDYVKRSLYPLLLQPFFDRGCNLKLIILEELVADKVKTISDLYAFLGVEGVAEPTTLPQVNKATSAVNISERVRAVIHEKLQGTVQGTEKLIGREIKAWRNQSEDCL